jgi:hypothetical protein
MLGSLLLPSDAGQRLKTGRFGLGLAGFQGLLKYPSMTLKNSEKPLLLDVIG